MPRSDLATISMPHLTGGSVGDLMASTQQRLDVLAGLFESNGHSYDELPPAYAAAGPLARWCWLVLTINGIEVESKPDGSYYPLTHYGIDFLFAPTSLSAWTFYLA